MEDYNKLCPECPFQYISDQCVNKCVKTGMKYDHSEQTTNDYMTTTTINVIFGDTNPEQGIEKNEEPILRGLLLATGIMILVLMITYRFRHCFTTVCDRSENNADKQSSLKPQFNDLMAGGSSDPMIKEKKCAKY